jgi:uncharacterized RDD family membrane protein YckC
LADFGIAAVEIGETAPELVPAPIGWRILAYLCDMLLGVLVLFVVLRWVITENYAEEWETLRAWLDGLRREYAAVLSNVHTPIPDRISRFSAKANAIPESARDLLRLIGTTQTIFFWAYFFTTEYFAKGASFGKKIFNLRVASTRDFDRPGILDSFVRSGWKALFFCSSNVICLLIGIIDAHIPFFSATRRSLHDMLTHTVVLDATRSPLELIEGKNQRRRRNDNDDNDRDNDAF